MIGDFKVIGSLVKGRAAGARNAKHDYLALLHINGPKGQYTRYLYADDLTNFAAMMRNYARKGTAVTVEMAPNAPYASADDMLAAAQGRSDKPPPSVTHVIDPFARPKTQSIAADPDLTHEDPEKVSHLEARKVLEERVANFDPDERVKLINLGRKKGLDQRSTDILGALETLDGEVDKLTGDLIRLDGEIEEAREEDGKYKNLVQQKRMKTRAIDARVQRMRELHAELAKRPMGWRRAEAERIKQLWAVANDTDTKWDEERLGTREEAKERLRRRANRLKGKWVEPKPRGAESFGVGRFTKLTALNSYESVDPTTQPMAYLLTDGWATQKEKGGAPINYLTKNESAALLSEFEPVGERILWGRVWKHAKTKGYFTMFPQLANDKSAEGEDFKADLKTTIKTAILNAAKRYTPDVAREKLAEGITFPMHVMATLEGELLHEFKLHIEKLRDDDEYNGPSLDDMESKLYEDDDAVSAREVLEAREHPYIMPDEMAMVSQAEEILQRKLSPEQYLVLMSKLNVHNSIAIDEEAAHLDRTPITDRPLGGSGLKTNRQVAEDLRDRFGGSTAKWESKVTPLWNTTVRALRDDRTLKLTGHEKAAVAAAFRIFADVLAQRKSELFTHSWRKTREDHKKTESVPEPRLYVSTAEGSVADAIRRTREEGTTGAGNLTIRHYRFIPHVSFWSHEANAELAHRLAIHLPERVEVDKHGKTHRLPHPADIRHYGAVAGTIPPAAIAMQEHRMKAVHEAYKKLDKLDAKVLRKEGAKAANHLASYSHVIEMAREYQSELQSYEDDLAEWKTGGEKGEKPAAPKRPDLPAGVSARDIVQQAVKVGGVRITNVSADELRTLTEWLAEKKEAKKSLRAGNVTRESFVRLIHAIESYEAARGFFRDLR